MSPKKAILILCITGWGLTLLSCFGSVSASESPGDGWPVAKTTDWYARQPWIIGCNYIPRSAVNQLEMWQADTFDPKTIEQELGWAQGIGFNTIRVFLHDKAWAEDPAGLKARMETFLAIASRHQLRTIFVIFDDCWNPQSLTGKQPDPKPGVHNSQWVQSPGSAIANDPTKWDRLQNYVTDLITTFGNDDRILMWDLYNEPGNFTQGEKSLPLLRKAFDWARAARPSQPLTAGIWSFKPEFEELLTFQASQSDVITFHTYDKPEEVEHQINLLKAYGKPLICTEYMARPQGCTFQNTLPILQREHIGAINWGLVSGKTNTIYPWQWDTKDRSSPPKVWFHDIFHSDGTPFDPVEIQFIKQIVASAAPAK